MTTDEKVLIVSVDGHVTAPMADYRPYVESRYRADFDEFLIRYEALRAGSRSVQLMGPRAKTFANGPLARYQAYMIESDAIDGEFDVDRRLKELGYQGVAAEVVFPNATPFEFEFGEHFIADLIGERCGQDLIEAGQRAYNRWLADFVSQSPKRLVGQAQVSLRDVDEAIETVEWARDHGLRGVVLPGIEPGTPRMHWDPALDPFWSALEDTGMTANVHGVSTFETSVLPPGVDISVAMRVISMDFAFLSHRPLNFMMWSGTFERHPRLKAVWTEQYSDWIPRFLAMADWKWASDVKSKRKNLAYTPRKPSEYWAQNCWAGMSIASKAEVGCRHSIGLDKVMFGVDFPHIESTYPNTLQTLQVLGDGVPDDELRKFLGQNAAALWELDLAALQPVVDQVGFTMAELRTPPPANVILSDDVERPCSQ